MWKDVLTAERKYVFNGVASCVEVWMEKLFRRYVNEPMGDVKDHHKLGVEAAFFEGLPADVSYHLAGAACHAVV